VEALAMTAFLSAFLLVLATRLNDTRTDVH